MNLRRQGLASLFVCLSFLASRDVAAGDITFNRDIRPILSENCFACHGPDSNKRKAGLRLDDADSAYAALKSGNKAIVPGSHAESELFRRITTGDTDDQMPPLSSKKTLTPAQKDLLTRWIDEGAIYEQHWAFVRPKRQEPPSVKNESWIRTPIDRFILHKQEDAGIEPNPEADKRTLIRRAYLDLIGLPPTPDEVKAFTSDSAPDAFERLLDSLLAKSQFGERWARHWLDVARFAESHGYEQDYDRPYAYHYRDFVIKAFNQDLPFNEFVRWQIAGDEIAPENPLALAATGFLGAGTHATQITKSQVEKERYDELDDMSRTTSVAFLGLTLGCARCHDHKYDPIPTEDYYRLASTFTTTVRSNVDVNIDPEGYRRAKESFDAEHNPLVEAVHQYEENVLRPRLDAWLKESLAQDTGPQWVTIGFENAKSENEGVFTRLPDDSYLVSGRIQNTESYTLTAKPRVQNITGLRLEAIGDHSFNHGGPGRGDDGDFGLSKIALSISTGVENEKPKDIPLVNPRADYAQPGSDIAGALDDQDKTGWSVGGALNGTHAAVFETASPVSLDPTASLVITLSFKMKDGHSLGRFRVFVTTKPQPLSFAGPTASEVAVAALEQLKADPTAALDSAQTDAILAYYRQLDEEWRLLQAKVDEHARSAPVPQLARMMICSEGVPAIRTHTQGGDFLEHTNFLTRGDPNQKREIATQGFVHALMKEPETYWQVQAPEGSRLSFRRASLANWITDFDRGAGFLLARVIVNRLWQYHMGRGLVSTSSDFGLQGAVPTHPELLDWLAFELVSNGWRLKPIHKLIVTSAVYRQSAEWDDAKASVDHANTSWWRYPRRRLEAEAIRDSMLAVSGVLDDTTYGAGTLDPNQTRRSIYFMVKRSRLIPMMMLFDAPDTIQSLATRATTTIAPQALLMINNEAVRSWAENFARGLERIEGGSETDMIRRGYWIAVSREPDETELTALRQFVSEQEQSYIDAGKPEPRHLSLTDFCQVLMSLNEFVYIE